MHVFHTCICHASIDDSTPASRCANADVASDLCGTLPLGCFLHVVTDFLAAFVLEVSLVVQGNVCCCCVVPMRMHAVRD